MIERYTTPQMNKIWSEQNKFETFLEVELAATAAWVDLGVVPQSDFDKIKQNVKLSLARIKELEQETKHDVIAFTRSLSESLGEEKKWIHYGLTSTDIVDSANAILLRQANEIIESKLIHFLEVLKTKAYLYKDTPCIGRTHGIHADITSFGLKWALWYDEMNRNLLRFRSVRKEIERIKISGAVGNFANTPLELEEKVAKKLQLDFANISTQVLSRDFHANYIFTLAQISNTIEKIALEIRHLQRTEVREVSEYFSPNQKGSSAMPHKKNPIASENMCGIARIMRSYVSVAMENNALWHERDISHSSTERIILPDATSLLVYMLERYQQTLEKLLVYPNNMLKNIELTHGVIFSSRVLHLLIDENYSREDAYDLVQSLSLQSWDKEISFQQLVIDALTPSIELQKINSCFTMEYYLKQVDAIFRRVF